MEPPLALDVDGTMTRGDGSIDPRLYDLLGDWTAPVVVATGKAFPYPVALCNFLGIEENVVAETGGIVFAGGELAVNGDGQAARAVADEFVEAGYDIGWGDVNLVNRWRETEVAISLDAPLEPLREIADRHGQEVVDTGYAYHVKSPAISKGKGLQSVADLLGVDADAFVAIGDSENDVSTFDVTGRSYAVANADEKAKRAADAITSGGYSDGTLEVLNSLR